jgi:two-component system, sensor histidine kinase and response regulator
MGNGAILIIEDNKDIRVPISIMLGNEGFDVFEAEDCRGAFDRLADEPPDLILTDLLMPEMTGLEFIRQIRRTSGLLDIPIIAMSAYDPSYLAAAVLAGANAALHKPEDMDKLVETIKEVLRHSGNNQERLQYAGNGGGHD